MTRDTEEAGGEAKRRVLVDPPGSKYLLTRLSGSAFAQKITVEHSAPLAWVEELAQYVCADCGAGRLAKGEMCACGDAWRAAEERRVRADLLAWCEKIRSLGKPGEEPSNG